MTQTTTTPAPTVVAVPSPTKEIEIDPACERLQKTFDLATQLAADTITSGNTALLKYFIHRAEKARREMRERSC